MVANEVRNLSSQSKDAAVEIDAVSSEGTNFSNEAIESLKEIVPNMAKTNMLVQKIVSANLEQSAGVSHINNAIQELNVSTLQNATNSEMLVEGAEALSKEADGLKKLIEYFNIH